MERLERKLGVAIEMLALFIPFWLTATPPVAEARQAAAEAKGREHAKGASVAREVADDATGDGWASVRGGPPRTGGSRPANGKSSQFDTAATRPEQAIAAG